VWIQKDKQEGFQKWAIAEIAKMVPGDKPRQTDMDEDTPF